MYDKIHYKLKKKKKNMQQAMKFYCITQETNQQLIITFNK